MYHGIKFRTSYFVSLNKSYTYGAKVLCGEQNLRYLQSCQKFQYTTKCLKRNIGSYLATSAIYPQYEMKTLPYTMKLNNIFFQSRSFSASKASANAKLLYLQNPFLWLNVRLEAYLLRSSWDSLFTLKDFTLGAKQAICSILTLISRKQFDDLKCIVSLEVVNKFLKNVEASTDLDVKDLKMNPEDILVTVVQDIRRQQIVEKRYCDIEVIFIATSNPNSNKEQSFKVLEIKTRFYREYTKDILPEWIVRKIEIQRINRS